MMAVAFEKIVMDESNESNNITDDENKSEASDVERNTSGASSFTSTQIPLMIPSTQNTNFPRKRGRPTKAESEKHRLAALYHGASSSNGISSDSNAVLLTSPTPKKRGRPPKSDSEKSDRPKGLLRIALGPKQKMRRIDVPEHNDNEASPFPLVQQTDSVKKSRGRPRIHPPKDPSVKRPRGRPRLIPLEGEEAIRSAYLKLKRDNNKKDLIIKKLTERLQEFGHPVDDILQELTKPSLPQNDQREEHSRLENDSSEDARTTPEPSCMEDTHQTYIGLFADNENKDKDNSDGDESE